jgi:hypothetical protein
MLQAEELPAPGEQCDAHRWNGSFMGGSWEFHGKLKEFMGFLWDV